MALEKAHGINTGKPREGASWKSKRTWDKGGRDAGRLFRVQSRQFPPEKVEEVLGELRYTMLSMHTQKLFQTAQHLPLLTDALGTVLDLGILVLNWWKIYRAHSFKTSPCPQPPPISTYCARAAPLWAVSHGAP